MEMSEVNAQIPDNTGKEPVIPDGWKMTHIYLRAMENGVAGRKDDAGKPRIWEVMDGFKRALWAVARVGTWGGEVKYSDRPFDNWANVPDGYRRYSNSRERHYLASDGDINEESGMPHEWHAVWCALAALELKLREKSDNITTIQESIKHSTHPNPLEKT